MGKADRVIAIAEKFKGIAEYSPEHKAIINGYNSHAPLARGYKVQLSDAWCMAFVSYCFIQADAVEALGKTECGCQEYLEYAIKNDMITENPVRGDIALYDWNSDGRCDHVGIVTRSNANGYVDVIEGNKSDSVGIRNISKNSRFIVAFVRPRYAKDAVSDDYVPGKIAFADSYNPRIAGKYRCTASDFLALRFGPSSDFSKFDDILPGDIVQSYGYYTGEWYLVTYNGRAGFCHKNWLQKV